MGAGLGLQQACRRAKLIRRSLVSLYSTVQYRTFYVRYAVCMKRISQREEKRWAIRRNLKSSITIGRKIAITATAAAAAASHFSLLLRFPLRDQYPH
jgi:hypothetical protein